MTDVHPSLIPSGWYPDPSNPSRERWWDGSQWSTEVVGPSGSPYGSYEPGPGTPWIWLNILAPLLALIPAFFIDFDFFRRLRAQPTMDRDTATAILRDFVTQPAVILTCVLLTLALVGSIVFAYLDWRELTRRRMKSPFHWGFSFFMFAGLLIVYRLGRAIVVKLRTGRGAGLIVAAILSPFVFWGVIYAWYFFVLFPALIPGFNPLFFLG
jgi:hypothetical protein